MNQTNSAHELIFPALKIDTKLKDGVYKKGRYGTSSYEIDLLEDTEVSKGFFIKDIHLRGRFKWQQAYLDAEIAKGTIVSIKTKAFSPSYEKKEYEPEVPWNIINRNFNVGTNEIASTELKDILPDIAFDYPKPVSLIKYLLNFINANIILDFFAGSGTTLHATMQLNAEDGGHRQCILVTNNENGICENVTYERNKRVIRGYTTPKGEQMAGLTGNTLRYYKTDFVNRTRSVQNMRRLVNLSTDMLCIKEDLYAEQPTFCGERTYKNIFRYFDNGRKQMLVIYREEAIERLVELIYGMDVTDKIKIYVFSPSEDPWEDSFEDVSDKVELCALPAAIYNAYRRILPKKKDAAATPEEDDAATHKAENPVNGMLNFTDEGDEA